MGLRQWGCTSVFKVGNILPKVETPLGPAKKYKGGKWEKTATVTRLWWVVDLVSPELGFVRKDVSPGGGNDQEGGAATSWSLTLSFLPLLATHLPRSPILPLHAIAISPARYPGPTSNSCGGWTTLRTNSPGFPWISPLSLVNSMVHWIHAIATT